MPRSAFGYIYVLANPAMPHVVKIGKSRSAPHLRAAKLSRNTAVPAAFQVIFQCRVYDCDAIEQLIHRALVYRRYTREREFYAVSPDLAVSLVRLVILSVANAESEFLAGLSPLGRKLYEARKARGDPPLYELDRVGGKFCEKRLNRA
jgi:hypothetical protein